MAVPCLSGGFDAGLVKFPDRCRMAYHPAGRAAAP